MPRKIEISVPAEDTDELVAEFKKHQGLLSLRVQKGVSIKPAGDLVTVEITNDAMASVLHVLDARHIGRSPDSSYSSSSPLAVVSAPGTRAVAAEISESSWEEMDTAIVKESSFSANTALAMLLAGALAAFGLATNALHIVIGAMVIAPGFEPISRIAVGLVSRGVTWRRGIVDTLGSYTMLIIGAALASLAMGVLNGAPLGSQPAYLSSGALLTYWTTITGASVLISTAAGLAGAVLIAANRSVLTSGVMIALALVPGAAIIGMGMIATDSALTVQGLLRWLLDAGLVLLGSLIIFGWKQHRTHRRRITV